MRTMKHLAFAAIAASALALAGCGGGGSSSQTSLSGTPGGGTAPAPTTPEPTTPESASGTVMSLPQTTGLAAAVEGGTTTVTITAGSSMMVGGVQFTCAGDEDCTVTLALDAMDGTVSATWEGAGADAGVTAEFVDPLENMNEANEAKIAAIMLRAIDAPAVAADPAADPPVAAQPAGADDGAQLGGLKSGGTIGTGTNVMNAGADNIDSVTLTGGMDDPDNPGTPLGRSFDPNVATSTLRAMADDSTPPNPSNDIGSDQAGALGLMGWSHKVLHADWGDTAGGLDAGIETAALIYSNVEMPEPVAFSALSTTLVDATLQTWFSSYAQLRHGVSQPMATPTTDDPNNAVNIADAAADHCCDASGMNALVSPTGQAFDATEFRPSRCQRCDRGRPISA